MLNNTVFTNSLIPIALIILISIIILLVKTYLFGVVDVIKIDTSSKFAFQFLLIFIFEMIVFDKLKEKDKKSLYKNVKGLYEMAVDKVPSIVKGMK